jgi:hypothetical protein
MRLRGKEIESDIVFSNVEKASKKFENSVVWVWWLDDC